MEKYLKKIPFWENLSSEEQELMKKTVMITNLKKGEAVYGAKREQVGMMYVISGSIRLYLLSEEGKEITLFYIKKDETCVMATSYVRTKIKFETQLIVAEDTDVIVVPIDITEKIIRKNLYARCYMDELIIKRFTSVMWILQELLFKTFDKRLATYLIEKHEENDSLEICITQEQIAIDINSAREVVARMLKQFVKDGIIEKSRRGKIEIKDIMALRKLVG